MTKSTGIFIKRIYEVRYKMEKNNLIIENEKELWHYTNFSTLDGIIRKREIWFGSTDNVNDKKELSDFIDKLKDAVLSEVKTEKKRQKTYLRK